MTVQEYISTLAPERAALISSLHNTIIDTNKKVKAEIGRMMGAEMIQYKIGNYFVYGLASVKNYMSLHAMPLYGHKPIHEKYSKLLTKATFQKGCINFKNAEEMPLNIAKDLLTDCAKIDWEAMIEKYKKK